MKKRKPSAFFCGQYTVWLDRWGRLRLPDAMRETLAAMAGGRRRLLFCYEDRLCIQAAAHEPQPPAEAIEAAWGWFGKVKVPRCLLERAGLHPGDDLLLIGVQSLIEVWTPADWAAEEKRLMPSNEMRAKLHAILDGMPPLDEG